jgi:hydroxymethylglutaryl-CoA reductase
LAATAGWGFFVHIEDKMSTSAISGFYSLAVEERLALLGDYAGLDLSEVALLRDRGLGLERADRMIENVVGVHELPLGIATNFQVNGRDVLVPMAIEEPSVVAGASLAAKLARAGGGFRAHADEPVMIGQMQVLDLADPTSARFELLRQKTRLLEAADAVDPVIVNLGGGARDVQVRVFESSPVGPMLVVHLLYDCRDAMGANAVNTAVERLAPMVEEITGGRVLLRILSNLADHRLARARCSIPIDALAFGEFEGIRVAKGIVEAWAFAATDSYRAATHNKGIMNGIDAVLIATGNDWRAVEAGAHAYAARSGHYTSLSTWTVVEATDQLIGTLELPLVVGTVGGATRVHPTAQVALKILNVSSARELAEIIAAVGLAQNLAAIRALATEGIQRGHMALHARQVAMAVGATGDDVNRIAEQMVREKIVRVDRARELLES